MPQRYIIKAEDLVPFKLSCSPTNCYTFDTSYKVIQHHLDTQQSIWRLSLVTCYEVVKLVGRIMYRNTYFYIVSRIVAPRHSSDTKYVPWMDMTFINWTRVECRTSTRATATSIAVICSPLLGIFCD